MKPKFSAALFACGFATAALFTFLDSAMAAEPTFGDAQWLGTTERSGERTKGVYLWKEFELPGDVERATLRTVADFCEGYFSINDAAFSVRASGVLTVFTVLEPFGYPRDIDVTDRLRRGKNTIEFGGTGTGGPAAMAVRLDVTLKDGRTQTIVSDSSWSSRPGGTAEHFAAFAAFGPVSSDRWTDLSPDIAISPFDDYEQWQQAKGIGQAADAAKFQIADGFEIELVKSAGPDEGSWVSIACDPKGRFVIGREDQGLLRLTLPGPNADRSAIQVETINDTLKECRGLLFAHDSLFAIANESKAMYRLRDANGDDKYEQVEELFQLAGKGGHGRNGLALGPDGRVHLICGDSIELPTDVVDRTSPFTEHRRGEKTKEGFVLAFDRDGNHREILCTGMRNPYGIAFNPDGESFTYDADPEFDMGSPWYKSTRVLHLTAGSDFGWRGVTGQWPPHFPDHADNAPFMLDIGKGSPTAVLFGTQSNFPTRYKQALYILDWAYGRIVAIEMEPRGASYSGKATTFCKGRPFNVTSLCFGQDGAMYVVTGGRKTQSGLYRIRHTDKPQAEPEPTPQQVARRAHAAEQRKYRRKLESLLSSEAKVDFAEIQPALASADPKLRFVARTVVEHQPRDRWPSPLPSPTGGWEGLSWFQSMIRSADHGLINRNPPPESIPEQLSPSQAYALADGHRMLLEQYEPRDAIEEGVALPIRSFLDQLYLHTNSRANRAVVRGLAHGEIGVPIPAVMEQLERADSQDDEMFYLFVLRNATKSPGDWRTKYFQRLADARHWQGGEGMPRFIQRITDDALASIPEAERAKYAAMVKPEAHAVDDSPLVQARPVVKTWKADDVPSILSATTAAKPDLTRGKEMFAAALCIRCHRFGTSGHAVGPDLTGLARRFSRRDMLEHVIVPSKVIAEQYRTVLIETTDGRVVSGRILNEGDFRLQKLRIATNPLDPRQVTEVAKSDIESHTMTNTSLMPEGLLNTLSEAEIRDLLAYLETADVAP